MKMKDMRPYSVWKTSYSKRWLLTHPWIAIREFWYNLRAAYWRSKYGFASRDVWEFGFWFLDVVPQMLKYLAENGCGYPGDDKFPTPESWRDHLLSIANLLENARDEVRDKKNEYYPQYVEETNKNWKREWITDEKGNRIYQPIDSTITKKYFAREKELSDEQDVMIEEALKLLIETPLRAIWD